LLGKVQGNCHASERIDIHSGGSLTGDVITACISIEDGAFIRGIIDIPPSVEGFSPRDVMNSGIAQRGSLLAAIYDAQAEDEIANGQYEVPDDELDLEELLIRWRSGTPAHEHSRNTR
jgi:cytoskeletal protein CcmA (bactofilin family)